MKALIIDDERTARADLRALLSQHPEVSIVGEAALIDDATALLRRGGYDLVFLDIQLLGGSGFDLVPEVSAEARVIFISAFDQFALRAFEVNALDYLQKPVRVERLADALQRLQENTRAIPRLLATDLVQVRTGPGAARFVRVQDIVLIGSQDNYSEVTLASGERLFVRQTLANWEEQLPASHFMRVHRQTVISLTRVEGFAHENEETTLLRIAGIAEPVRARRQHWPELRVRLTALGIPA